MPTIKRKWYPGASYHVTARGNHRNDIFKDEEKPLGQFIGRINSKYAKYYNKKYNYIGHLFQDRYFSEIIESDSQMLETSRYIHHDRYD